MVGSLDQDVRHGLLVGLPYTLVERARNGGAQPNPEDAAYARQRRRGATQAPVSASGANARATSKAAVALVHPFPFLRIALLHPERAVFFPENRIHGQ
jgi:hypothetical protein